MSESLKIVFMGTPTFAVPCLQALLGSSHEVCLVVTQPDRPKGRGRKLMAPPVKALARQHGLTVIQPARVRDAEFIQNVARLAPDVLVVVAFGQLLPTPLMATARLGALNLHASLLPRYRGPAPIQWAIINGETLSGISAMQMEAGLDTGPILDALAVPIYAADTSAILHDRLAGAGARLILPVLAAWNQGHLQPRPQAPGQATYAPLLTKKDGRIDWHQPATAIDAFVRGMNPWPGAFTYLGNNRLKIWKVEPLVQAVSEIPGTRLPGFDNELRIAAGQGAVSVLEIQAESARRLSIQDFLRGAVLPPDCVLV